MSYIRVKMAPCAVSSATSCEAEGWPEMFIIHLQLLIIEWYGFHPTVITHLPDILFLALKAIRWWLKIS